MVWIRRIGPSIAALVLVLGIAAVSASTTVAQDATPEASSAASSGDPEVGDEVSYVDEEGEEIAVVSVVEVTDPFDGFSEFFSPEEGARYVAVEVSVESTGDELEVEPYHFTLHTDGGFLYSYAFVSQPEGDELPELESTEVEEGDSTSGVVFFAVPEGAELSRILWQPDSGRLLVLADLRSA